MSWSVWPDWVRKVWKSACDLNCWFFSLANSFWTWASVSVMCCFAASAWYQYDVIRNSITFEDSDWNSWLQSFFSWAAGVLASVGISLRAWAMQLLNSGGSLGTITGAPGRLDGVALCSDVHPVIERGGRDRVAGHVGDGVSGDTAAAGREARCKHKKGAERRDQP